VESFSLSKRMHRVGMDGAKGKPANADRFVWKRTVKNVCL